MSKKRILSGIQPTAGEPHFGNYFGAIQNWVRLQADYDCVFSVVNYHAMTMPYQPDKLRENTWALIFNLIAVGVKPENLSIQSLIPEHTELGWILNCFCSYGELSRMTQFKEKSEQGQSVDKETFVSAGLFDYPVLQAADILLYKADFVPVGKDQTQHLELSRHIADRFNRSVGKDYFVLPEILFTDTPKVNSTAEPSKKMSKSLGDKHFISIFEDSKVLDKKIRSAVTEAGGQPTEEIGVGLLNLLTLLKAAGNIEAADYYTQAIKEGKLVNAELKNQTSLALQQLTEQFRTQRAEVLANKKQIKEQIKDSSAAIRLRAQTTLKEVKELAGLLNY